jgi:hypothetical protein
LSIAQLKFWNHKWTQERHDHPIIKREAEGQSKQDYDLKFVFPIFLSIHLLLSLAVGGNAVNDDGFWRRW